MAGIYIGWCGQFMRGNCMGCCLRVSHTTVLVAAALKVVLL